MARPLVNFLNIIILGLHNLDQSSFSVFIFRYESRINLYGDKYKTFVDLFDKISHGIYDEKTTLLGQYSHTSGNKFYYINGDHCSAVNYSRETVIEWECGTETAIRNIEEDQQNRCHYLIKMTKQCDTY